MSREIKTFLVVDLNFDGDIKFPYKKKIFDMSGKQTYYANEVINNIINELEKSKEYHKNNKRIVKFLDDCIYEVDFVGRAFMGSGGYIKRGNWEFEIKIEYVELDKDCIYICK